MAAEFDCNFLRKIFHQPIKLPTASTGGVVLNERSYASFLPAQNAASCFIELSLSNLAYLPQLSMAVQRMDDNAYVSHRDSRILIRLPTPSDASEIYRNLETSFGTQNVIETIRHIPLAEHSFVNCQIMQGDQGAIPFDATTSTAKLRSKFPFP